ncbi:hypothetical protein BC939DRAFT_502728 [Gamsiella multidivaricata]|uniref:uncharacterized protein n=1 Tax=Gamsiella multidivaricata TaxID=101098 RepID=UPI00221E8D3B|nr:uncharacterized protein BC939DRAFT_502728 [Gamsiella multidivaricata]KAI7824296.1 hypothetical protein BC939DRAFT_502728 [Gamsiella multidivaricata]
MSYVAHTQSDTEAPLSGVDVEAELDDCVTATQKPNTASAQSVTDDEAESKWFEDLQSRLCDAYGRRILLYNATVNLAISQATIWFAASASNLFGCRLLYLDGIYLGLTSGTLLGNPTIFACVGPSLGGFIVKATGDLTSIIQISLVNFVVLSVYLFALPESLRKQDKPLAAKDENTRTSLTKEESLSALACAKSVFILVMNLIFRRTSYKDGLYFSFSAMCVFTVLWISPLSQSLYKCYIVRLGRIEQHDDASLESEIDTDSSFGDQSIPATESLMMDAFFLFGEATLLVVSYFIVPLFMSVPILYIVSSMSMLTTIIPSTRLAWL